jgi:hypothetical protein
MAYQIIKSGSAGRWIKQPNRLVKTFPSGLCMIQQDYIADRNSISYEDFREGDILSQEDSSPCIDNAYIFPAPDYQDMGNGFVKCTVVAYGRVNTTGNVSVPKILSNFSYFYYRYFEEGDDYFVDVATRSGILDVEIKKIVINPSETINFTPSNILNIYLEDGTELPLRFLNTYVRPSQADISTEDRDEYLINTNITSRLNSYDEQSYGFFKEVTIAIIASTNAFGVTFNYSFA